MPAGRLVVMPLGGLGEIGMNCLVLEHPHPAGGGRRVAIDCGASFPQDDEGVDLVHPRFDALLDEPAALAGVVLTHGHEDHVGAVPYLVEALARAGAGPLAIHGPRYALELCRERLDEVGTASDRYRLRHAPVGERLELGGMAFEPVRVTHSTVDATALVIGTPAGTVVHTGDFKIDGDPYDGELTDEARLARAGDEGVALLLSDSTNVFREGEAGSERLAGAALERVIARAEGRVVVGLFASNVHRLAALGAIALQHKRHLCLLGRSLRRHGDIARRLGKLQWPSDLVVAPEIAATLPPRRLLYLATGTQGEARGALARLAAGDVAELALAAGDLVILSSRIIPGSERAVNALCDGLVRRGVELVTRLTDPEIHVSGHAQRGEQRRMIALCRPRAFIPLHGTLHHLHEHAKLAREAGVGETMVLVDGQRAELGPGGLGRLPPVPSGKVAIGFGKPIGEEVLRDRRTVARSGIVFVALGWREGEPEVRASAVGVPDAGGVCAAAALAARATLTDLAARAVEEASWIGEVQRAVRAKVAEHNGQRPAVEVQLARRGR